VLLVLVLLIAAVVFYVGSGRFMGMMGMGSMARHQQGMMGGIPLPYGGKINPLALTREVLDQGRALYQARCAVCHGEDGRGDGPAAAPLDPPPADLTRVIRMPIANDDYLLWTISEGGAGFGSAMPSFKEQLNELQRWQVITFLRQL